MTNTTDQCDSGAVRFTAQRQARECEERPLGGVADPFAGDDDEARIANVIAARRRSLCSSSPHAN